MIDLLKRQVFLPFFLTQFLGAFNDNAYKLSVLTLISYQISVAQSQSETYQAWASTLYILPYFLFSAIAGQLADYYDKAKIARWVKLFEVLLMLIGAFALYHHIVLCMMFVLAGMGIHSCFFGPLKYAILPELLPQKALLDATALVEASTFLAIFLGTVLGTLVIGNAHLTTAAYAIFLTNAIAVLGLVASLFIPKAPAKQRVNPINWNIWCATRAMMQETLTNPKLRLAIFAISWFWLLGIVLITKLPDYIHYILAANSDVFAIFLALFSTGIVCGTLFIARLLKGRARLTYIPLLLVFISLFLIDIYFVSPNTPQAKTLLTPSLFFKQINNIRIICDFFLASFCGGLFIVPLFTYLQIASETSIRARVIATSNISNALFMVIGSLFVLGLVQLEIKIATVFLILALSNLLVAGWLKLSLANLLPVRI